MAHGGNFWGLMLSPQEKGVEEEAVFGHDHWFLSCLEFLEC